MAIKYFVMGEGQVFMVGLSTDTKPTTVPDGCSFYEEDTAKTFRKTTGAWGEALNSSYGGGGSAWGGITGTLSNQTDLQNALNAKQNSLGFTPENSVNKGAVSGYASLDAGTKVPIAQVPTGATASTVCIGNDIRLSDARTPTTHDILTLHNGFPGGTTNFLRADGAFAAPGGGSDPWTYVQVNGGADFTTTSASAVDVTGLAFTPAANTTYEFEAMLMIRTATATVNPRVGFAWPTGMTDGVVMIKESQAVNTVPITANGNINAASLIAVGGLPNTTQSWPVRIQGMARSGATPSGNIRVQLASETAGTTVRIVARSFLKYRTLAF